MVPEKRRRRVMPLEVAKRKPDAGQLLVRLSACAVCRADLHIVDGELPDPKLPLIPGHQIVGRIEQVGTGVEKFSIGDRVGIPWLGWTDGDCVYCRSNRENLCDRARFTGYTMDGGYGEFVVADARFCFHLPEQYDDVDVDRKSTRLNSSHSQISYAVFCLKKKKIQILIPCSTATPHWSPCTIV